MQRGFFIIMMKDLDAMIEVFKKCLKLWGVDTLLKCRKVQMSQTVDFSGFNEFWERNFDRGFQTTVSRDAAEIELNGSVKAEIIPYGQFDFVLCDVRKILFHADLPSIRNQYYDEYTPGNGRETAGSKDAFVYVFGTGGAEILAFGLPSVYESVGTIRRNIRLSCVVQSQRTPVVESGSATQTLTVKPRPALRPLPVVGISKVVSILKDLKSAVERLNNDDDKAIIRSMIERIEKLVPEAAGGS